MAKKSKPLNLTQIKDIDQLRDVTRLLENENAQLHEQLQKLSNQVDALQGNDAKYDIEDDLTYKTSEVRLSATLCDSQILVDTSTGVSATTATGTVNVVVTDLSQPLEVAAIDLEIQFDEDEANPFGPLNARFSLPNKVYEIGPAFECWNLE